MTLSVGLDLVDIDDVDGYVLEPSDNSGTLSNQLQLLEKNTNEISASLFENISYPLVELNLVGIDNTDEHALELSDNTGTPPNHFLIKKYK